MKFLAKTHRILDFDQSFQFFCKLKYKCFSKQGQFFDYGRYRDWPIDNHGLVFGEA